MRRNAGRLCAVVLLAALLLPWALGALCGGHVCAYRAGEIGEFGDEDGIHDCSVCAAIRNAVIRLAGLVFAAILWVSASRWEMGEASFRAGRYVACTPVRLFVRLND